ncbi:MAG: GxxExxY protein [Muribaculaceae bacterium]|nr:GxxExxY protein [Muribaculaceae bacterium]
MSELLYPKESYAIIGAAIEVHKQLGCGFTEPVYQEAFAEELRLREIPFEREKVLTVTYKGKVLTKEFRADFVCYNKIIVELKAVVDFAEEHYAQVYNYLKASEMQLGLLINFGKTSLEYKRIPATRKFSNGLN